MISDNAKTFRGTELKKYNAKNGISWRFNLSKSPWWGGMFERLVRSVKRCLIKEIGNSKLTFEELMTLLVEIEMMLNNRPLTYIDEAERTLTLTPAHMFYGRRILNGGLVENDVEVEEYGRDEVIRHVVRINKSVQHFWDRWVKEYLLELREHQKVHGGVNDIQVDDVVIIHEKNVKRHK